jgi:eukaryotic-like serine/threonine-protein kinase
VFRQPTGDNDIWVIDLARNLPRRITDGPPADAHPLWDPDGQHVVFGSQRLPSGAPLRQTVNGSGKPEPLFSAPENGVPLSWTADRRFVLLRRNVPQGSADLLAISMDGQPSVPIAQSAFEETEGQFSPDGKWVAFVSNETGRPEVFVQSFPEGRERSQVSTAGGAQVRWARDGKEIFYIAPDGQMTAVSITVGRGPAPELSPPVALFETHLATGTNVIGNKAQYAVSRDGRFLLNSAIESSSAPIVVSVNWMRELRR